MFKKTISYLVLVSLIFSFFPLIAQAESGSFDQSIFNLDQDTEFSIVINLEDLDEINNVKVVLEYDPTVITYLDFTPGLLMDPVDLFFSDATTFAIATNTEQLLIAIVTEGFFGSISGSGELATVIFQTNANGGNTDIEMISLTVQPSDMDPFTITGDTGENAVVSVVIPDTSAPVRDNGTPSGALAHDTTETTISLTTDEDATCHYSDTADTIYADSDEMTTTGTTSHSVLVDGLISGEIYNYYIRCSDALGNINDNDYPISFSIDEEPVVLPTPSLNFVQTTYTDIDNNENIYLVLNASDLDEVSSVDLVLEYNPTVISYIDFIPGFLMDPVDLFFSTSTAVAIDVDTEQLMMTVATDMWISMFGASGSGELATLTFETNASGGTTDIEIISFTVYPVDFMADIITGDTGENAVVSVVIPDTSAPVRDNGTPSGALAHDTTETTISLTTDEDATCHYSDTADTIYADSDEMTTTGTTSHSVLVDGLISGEIYNYYIRCSDALGNINDNDYPISFSIDEEPVVVEPEPIVNSGGGGSSYIILLKKQEAEKLALVTKQEKEILEVDEPAKEDVEVLGFTQFTDSSLLRNSNGDIYLIEGVYKKHILSLEELLKYSNQTIYDVSDDDLAKYQTRKYSNGDLIREEGEEKIFHIVDTYLEQVLNIEELRNNFSGQEVFNVSKEEMALYVKRHLE